MIRLSKDIISRRSIPKRPAALATLRIKVAGRATLPVKTHRKKGTAMKEHLVIPDRRSWQHCTKERFQSDASHIALDRPTIGNTGPAQGTSPQ
jgi:hypothetical protein